MQSENRKERRAARRQELADTAGFLKIADKFIARQPREHARVPATELHMALLYAAARYNAHVANVVLGVPDHERFVTEMVEQYRDMLRQHLADPALVKPPAT